MSRFRTPAPAKINWTLEVLGRRPDGYHQIRSVMQTISICDDLMVSTDEDLKLGVRGTGAVDESNLVLRVGRLVLDEACSSGGGRFRLKKEIPVSAGLGGGSSDGAAAARLLDHLLGLGYEPSTLSELAGEFSRDASFFIHGGTAEVSDMGQVVRPLPDVPETWLVVLAPQIRLQDKTARMYRSLDETDFTDGGATDRFVAAVEAGEPPEDDMLTNVFEAIADAEFPRWLDFRDALAGPEGRAVHLAGSGPAMFCLAAGRDEANTVAKEVRSRARQAQVFAARTMTAAEATRIDPVV